MAINKVQVRGRVKVVKGAVFPHKEGPGFSIELKAFPVDGRLVVLPPDSEDNRNR